MTDFLFLSPDPRVLELGALEGVIYVQNAHFPTFSATLSPSLSLRTAHIAHAHTSTYIRLPAAASLLELCFTVIEESPVLPLPPDGRHLLFHLSHPTFDWLHLNSLRPRASQLATHPTKRLVRQNGRRRRRTPTILPHAHRRAEF